ncbi:hypothetical protein QJS10_CPA03g01279 [Acorus calamus]|uniref:Uncharacterized protein n=1 Tax=Acorus calamus TaxID=4465 RepID=A0AAV9F7N2_ACOCL|nr:hypothetical protein QJS10_CPA03g01279 [Acorus calamus]
MVGSSSDVRWEEEVGNQSSKKSFLQRFRSGRGLMVTDITNTEWCEKQMEFILLHGQPKQTNAMKAGSSRHAELEKHLKMC